MSGFFNVDIDKTVSDYKLSIQNPNDSFKNEFKRSNDNLLNIFARQFEEDINKMSMYLVFIF